MFEALIMVSKSNFPNMVAKRSNSKGLKNSIFYCISLKMFSQISVYMIMESKCQTNISLS